MTPDDLLTRTFAEVTETTDYPTTPMAAVVTHSRTLRHGRRRTTALLAAAAAVVLVGGSAAVWLSHDADTTPSPSHRIDPAGSLPDLPQGDAPRVPYLEADKFVTAGGDRITSPALRKAQLATPYGVGVLVVARRVPGRPFVSISLVSGGSTSRLGCGTPGLALGGDAPAYWLSDTCGLDVTGRLVRGTTETPTTKSLALYPVGTLAGGVVANAVWANSARPDGPVVVAADGSLRRIPHLSILVTVSPAGNLVTARGPVARGLVPVVANASTGAVVWRASGWDLGHFSGSGRYVVGTRDVGAQSVAGVGDVVGIWDAATGRQVSTTVLPNMTIVGHPVWEGDDSVLVVAEDRHQQQAIVRVALDGTITRVTSVAPAGEGTYRLAAAP
jgi:hypothetical protein